MKEEQQDKVRKALAERGISAKLWYECQGDEDVVIVPPEFAEEGFLLELEEEA